MTTRSRKNRRARGLGSTAEEHRIRVPVLLDQAERELRDAEHRERAGDCIGAVRSLLAGRGLTGAARAHAEDSGDSDARQSVKNFVDQDWAPSAARIVRRCTRRRPAVKRS